MSSVLLTCDLLVRERRLSAFVRKRFNLGLESLSLVAEPACGERWRAAARGCQSGWGACIARKVLARRVGSFGFRRAVCAKGAKSGRHVIFGEDRTNERYWRCPLLLARLLNFWERSFEPPARLQAS